MEEISSNTTIIVHKAIIASRMPRIRVTNNTAETNSKAEVAEVVVEVEEGEEEIEAIAEGGEGAGGTKGTRSMSSPTHKALLEILR
jgi:hypothetical protein